MQLIETSSKADYLNDNFNEEYQKAADKLRELQKVKARATKEKLLADKYQQRVNDMEKYIKKTGYLKREFDDELVRRLIRIVRVINVNKIEIQFQSGIVMEQRVDFEE